MRTNKVTKKYCYNCGKIIDSDDFCCKYCAEDLRKYSKQQMMRCKYCLTEIPSGAKYCKTCQTKNTVVTAKEEMELLGKLKFAADVYKKQKYPDDFLRDSYKHTNLDVDAIFAYGKFSKAKRLFFAINENQITIRTLEFGKDTLLFDDIIYCKKISKQILKDDYNIKAGNGFSYDIIVINTIKGDIECLKRHCRGY